MDINIFLTFLILSTLVIIIPGPNVLVIVSTSLVHGKSRGLQTVVGTSFAMTIQLVIAAFSTSWFVQLLSDGFYVLKWLGVAYLVYLGFKYIKDAIKPSESSRSLTASASFTRGFVVSLTNPKTIVFFSAFLPQFVSSTEDYLQQIGVLSATFLLIAITLDSAYAVLSSKLKSLVEEKNMSRYQNGLSGLLFLGASAWLAVTRRGQ